MEIVLIAVVAVVIGALIYINHNRNVIDTNKDGKVDAKEVKAAAKVVKAQVKTAVKKSVGKAKSAVVKTAVAKKAKK